MGRRPNPNGPKYPIQGIVMMTKEMGKRIATDSALTGLSYSEVLRTYIEAGIAEADKIENHEGRDELLKS